ncbi:MAG: type II toxin-antitoxin system RelB/DinJ family antitoxin [Clostridia bacterium]|nr:type II toxin-antitoxin system RelB/DinJ family antitoxin [Clostridia bacterium]
MTYENISVRVDSDTKKQFHSFCLSVGLNPTTAITMYIKKVINEHRIPFEISNNINISNDHEYFNERMVEILLKAKEQVESGKGLVKTNEELEDLIK